MLPCREIVRILSSKEKISFAKWIELKLHLLRCKYCSWYNKHLKILIASYNELFKEQTQVREQAIKDLGKKVLSMIAKEKAGN